MWYANRYDSENCCAGGLHAERLHPSSPPAGSYSSNGETPDEKSQMADFRLCVYLRSDVACRVALPKLRVALLHRAAIKKNISPSKIRAAPFKCRPAI